MHSSTQLSQALKGFQVVVFDFSRIFNVPTFPWQLTNALSLARLH